MLKKQYLKSKPVCKVTFELPKGIRAERAALAGEFNDWDATVTPMKRLKSGVWKVTLELEKGREYQYRYLINDEEWHNDWDADKYVPNSIDGDNSVVVV
ncbi:MAG: isoamylase early set domain-containing protein [Anaerolineae bacterium]